MTLITIYCWKKREITRTKSTVAASKKASEKTVTLSQEGKDRQNVAEIGHLAASIRMADGVEEEHIVYLKQHSTVLIKTSTFLFIWSLKSEPATVPKTNTTDGR